MLTTLFTAIQGALANLTRGFLLVNLFPVVLFVAANASILKVVLRPAYDKLLIDKLTGDTLTFVIWLVICGTAAVVLSALQAWLFQLTEGENWPYFVRCWGHAVQRKRLDTLYEEARKAYLLHKDLSDKRKDWLKRIETRETGGSVPSAAAIATIEALRGKRFNGERIDDTAVDAAVQALEPHCRAPGGHAPSPELDSAKRDLESVIDHAQNWSNYRYLRTQNQLQATFPGDVFDLDPSSDNNLASTRFGNIGRTMRSYALRRYSLDLDIFWNRLQKVMADSTTSKAFDTLQGQKSLVDFLINALWLTVVTAVIWIPWLGVERLHPALFSAVAIGVPLLVCVLYDAACRAYVVFADQVRTLVDFFRWDILAGLRIDPPVGTKEEELLWQRLGSRIGYGKSETFLHVRKQ